MHNKRLIGGVGETIARHYLERIGYRFVRRNVATPWGEIDLMMKDGSCLIFIEVKYRRSARYGLPIEAVTARKLRCLVDSIAFLVHALHWEGPYRLDVVSVRLIHGRIRLRHDRGVAP
jgi:putative endonuclease